MQHYLSGHPQGPVPSWRSVHRFPVAARSALCWYRWTPPAPLPSELVLRLDTGRATPGTAVTDEHPLLARLAKLGLPVPDPLWPRELQRALPGFPASSSAARRACAAGDLMEGAFGRSAATARALARALAQVHAAGERLIGDRGRRGSAVSHTRDLLSHYLDYWRSKKPLPSTRDRSSLHLGCSAESTTVWATPRSCMQTRDFTICCWTIPAAPVFSTGNSHALAIRRRISRPAGRRWSGACRGPISLAEYRAHGGQEVSDFRLRYFEIWRSCCAMRSSAGR